MAAMVYITNRNFITFWSSVSTPIATCWNSFS